MADGGEDPDRWSHSTGEAQDFAKRLELPASVRSSQYSGVSEEVEAEAVAINPREADLAIKFG